MKKKIIPASFLRLISIIIFWLQKPSRNRKITISLLVLSFIFDDSFLSVISSYLENISIFFIYLQSTDFKSSETSYMA